MTNHCDFLPASGPRTRRSGSGSPMLSHAVPYDDTLFLLATIGMAPHPQTEGVTFLRRYLSHGSCVTSGTPLSFSEMQSPLP